MYLKQAIVIIVIAACCCNLAVKAKAQAEVSSEKLSSPEAARIFYKTGYELYSNNSAGEEQAKEALVFFNATMSLDSHYDYVLPDIINIAWKYPYENYSQAISLTLGQFIDQSCDLEVASKGISYLLERQHSREGREKVLRGLLNKYSNRNNRLASDLWMRLSFLRAETADVNTARQYLVRACTLNRYNLTAFTRLAELSKTRSESLPDYLYLQNLRNSVTVNPLDFHSAFNFGQYADSLSLFAPAAAAYKYCANLQKYLSGSNRIEPAVYRPWILSCYNAGLYSDCFNVLKAVRSQGDYDIMTEATAAAAATSRGDENTLQSILSGIDEHAKKILSGKLTATPDDYEKLAWFYAFLSDANSSRVLTWAQKAYRAEPNSPNADSLLAYALVINSRNARAKEILDRIKTPTQISAFARAKLLAKNNTKKAVELLNSSIAVAPGTFEARKAEAFLKTLGSEYSPLIEPNVLVTALKSDYGPKFFSDFLPPRDMLSLKMTTKGTVFSYGSPIKGTLAVINNYSEPLIVSSMSMFTGNIRIDARITGDASLNVPNLINKIVRPSNDISPGDAMVVNLDLLTGKVLKALNYRWSQAELNIEFTAYIDPVVSKDGTVRNALGIPPAKVSIKRMRMHLTTRYLQHRLEALNSRQHGEKMISVQLFAGLLSEQQEMAKYKQPLYRFKYAQPELLSSAIVKCITENDWVLKTQSIADVLMFKPDWQLTKAISDELDNPNWPVRLMAVYTLSKNADDNFKQVLEWTAKYDQNELVKNMAVLLLSKYGGTTAAGKPDTP